MAHNRQAVTLDPGPGIAVAPPSDEGVRTPGPALSKRTRAGDFLLVMAVAVLPLLLVTAFQLSASPAKLAPFLHVKLVRLVVQEILSLALLAYLLHRQGRDLGDVGVGFRAWDLAMSVVLLLGATFASYVVHVLFVRLHFVPSPADVARTHMWLTVIRGSTLGIVLVCVNPIFEELIVRAYVITEMRALSGSVVLGVFVSTALQAAYHLYQGGPAAARLAAVFLVFSIYFAKTRRAAPLILAHFYMDLFGIFR